MNRAQQILLVLAAVAFLQIMATVGQRSFGNNHEIVLSGLNLTYARIWTWQEALIKAGLFSLAARSVLLACRKRK